MVILSYNCIGSNSAEILILCLKKLIFKKKKMKKFSKLTVFYRIGFLQRKFDGNEFKKSKPLHIRSYLILFFLITASSKYFLCIFFPQNDKIQLYIGNTYNYLGTNSRLLIGIIGKSSPINPFISYMF